MPHFDRSLTYQFGCFFGPLVAEDLAHDEVNRLAEAVAAPVPDVAEPVVAFSSSQVGSALAIQTGSLVPQIMWQGGASIWKLTFTSARLDLIFDARGHADVHGGAPLTLSAVSRRVSANFARAVSAAHFPVNRIVVIVAGEASTEGSDAARLVARRFFRRELQEQADAGGLVEASGRTAERNKWRLSEKGEIATNCIEHGNATWMLEGRTPRTRLQWQLDINTAPDLTLDDKTRFTQAEIGAFFEQAVTWVEAKLRELD